jgi:putative endonuclease
MKDKYYLIYILECADKSLYTGITNDLENRMQEHNLGTGSKYVRSRLPFRLVYIERAVDKSDALKREIEIKNMSKVDKLKLINV